MTADDSPAFSGEPTAVSTTTIVPPDQLQAGAATVTGPHHAISLADGSVSTAIALPAYNPTVPALSLEYNSMAADPRPIFLTRFELGASLPASVQARLTVDGTPLTSFTYDTSADNPGDFIQIALQDDATGLSTGRHTYSITVKPNNSSAVTTSGSFAVINDAAERVRGRVVAGRAGPDRLRHRRGVPGHGRRHQPVVHRRGRRHLHQPGRRLLDPDDLGRGLDADPAGRHGRAVQHLRAVGLGHGRQQQHDHLRLLVGPADVRHRPVQPGDDVRLRRVQQAGLDHRPGRAGDRRHRHVRAT